ncbi:DNA-directed RNA polymerase subunit alpha [Candidatus Campbellbacteria bacterium RIFOXYC2_FULL_35_25]|uniref:DNA-directed RNA polymerase subunit alpha n=1 Tax=Candidatus Campbellbacteria bacterium RIFOXYC2_FULL_35_25 TaxID=1797582 RepID=A0A1F5EKN2_9BACT|nr:MAG: DNA-directed RNA polymerase subunit alpha [Candidatus Campbellbacteria bacterium RIFOXYC2_FULL_35_25]
MLLPSKPRIVKEEDFKGTYEIDGLYPGYGYTLGNSIRRIILSSLPGAAITSVKIDGVPHEFSTMDGVKDDVINMILNLKKVRVKMLSDEPQELTLKVKGLKTVTAKDIEVPGQVEILNPDQYIATITDKNTTLDMKITVEQGLGYLSKDDSSKGKVEIGSIPLDAFFTPIRRASYEVENMRVGDRTDFNRLRILIETDGTLTANAALENSIEIMIKQLKAVVGFKEEEVEIEEVVGDEDGGDDDSGEKKTIDEEFLKTRIDSLDLSVRTTNALSEANIRTVGGLARKKEKDLTSLEGLGSKGLQEIKRALSNFGITLKS